MKKIGFSKNIVNIYIAFEFHEWTGKHPIGKITQNLGAIDVVNHFIVKVYTTLFNPSMQKRYNPLNLKKNLLTRNY